jgi:hypothetical protein
MGFASIDTAGHRPEKAPAAAQAEAHETGAVEDEGIAPAFSPVQPLG